MIPDLEEERKSKKRRKKGEGRGRTIAWKKAETFSKEQNHYKYKIKIENFKPKNIFPGLRKLAGDLSLHEIRIAFPEWLSGQVFERNHSS